MKARAPTKTVGEFSFGNKKVPETTGIFNFTPATECPSAALGLCAHRSICYALKAERPYRKQVLPYRQRQKAYWAGATVSDFVDYFLACAAVAGKTLKVKVNALRFSEAGDFPSQEDVDKFTKVASALKRKGFQIYGYTARKDLDFSRLMKHATVQGSGFMLSNNFTVVDIPSGNHPVCAGDCRKCSMCLESKKRIVEVVKH